MRRNESKFWAGKMDVKSHSIDPVLTGATSLKMALMIEEIAPLRSRDHASTIEWPHRCDPTQHSLSHPSIVRQSLL